MAHGSAGKSFMPGKLAQNRVEFLRPEKVVRSFRNMKPIGISCIRQSAGVWHPTCDSAIIAVVSGAYEPERRWPTASARVSNA
jgi:hypothetical protein